MNIRRILLLLLVFNFLPPTQAQENLKQVLNNFSNHAEFKHASISFMAIDLQTGEEIGSINPDLSLPTASTAKLFSTATALEILGPDYRPQTRIYTDGKVNSEGVLNGNIWIRGGGDMTLGSKYFNKTGHEKDFLQQWADSLKKLGIKKISGALIADGSEFGYAGVPDGWSWSDIDNYYGAGPSGICIFDNMVVYKFKTGSKAGSSTELISMQPNIPDFTFHNYIKSEHVSGDHSYIFGGPYSQERFGTGSLPLNQSGFEVKGSIPDPEYQLAYELLKVLQKNGIEVIEGAQSVRRQDMTIHHKYTSLQLLWSHKGATILEIATLTNMKSINLFAEGLLSLVGYYKSGYGSTEEGIKQLELFWKTKFNTHGLFLNDGSGLSRSNGISARHFCLLLKEMNKAGQSVNYITTLPVTGKSGTLTNVCVNQPGQGCIQAKSGTMSRIKSYSGYVNSASGKKIAFAITVNNFTGTSSSAVNKIEKVLNALSTY